MNDFERAKKQAKEELRFAQEDKEKAKRDKFINHFGIFGRYILEAGMGGGFTASPHALDSYERALGLSIEQAWFLKRLMKYLPNIKPSMKRFALEANVSESKLSRIKSSLVKAGFIRDCGRDGERLEHVLDISPLFDAVFLCILLDPKSKVVISNAMEDVRKRFYGKGFYTDTFSFDLPLDIETGKQFAKQRGFTLDWNAVAEMQGAGEQNLIDLKISKERMLEVKEAIREGADGLFGIQYRFGEAYDFLKWLCATSLDTEAIRKIVRWYVDTAKEPNAKGMFEYVRFVGENPKFQQAVIEQRVYDAMAEL